MQAFEQSADNKPDNPPPRQSRGHDIHLFQKELHHLISVATELFPTLLQSILNELWLDHDHVHIWLLLCMMEISPAFVDGILPELMQSLNHAC